MSAADGAEPSGRTLVVQLADLGDLLLAAPAIKHLRSVSGELTLLTKPGNAALAEPLADRVIFANKHLYDRPSSLLNPRALVGLAYFAWSLRRQRFRRVVVLHHLTTRYGAMKFAALSLATGAPVRSGLDNGRGWFLTDRTPDRGFAAENEEAYWKEVAAGTEPVDLPRDVEAAAAILERYGIGGDYVVLHPGSGWYSLARRWPPEHFVRLAQRLHTELAAEIIIVGGAEERELASSIATGLDYIHDAAGETSLPALVSLLEGAGVFVGNNAGVAQIAGSLATPSVVIFGPTDARTWHVASPHSRAISRGLPCSPCLYHHFELGSPEGCATRECLVDLDPETVVRHALDLLRERVAV